MKITLPNGIVIELGPDDSMMRLLSVIEALGSPEPDTRRRVHKPKIPPVGTLDFEARPVIGGTVAPASLAPGKMTNVQLATWRYLVSHDNVRGVEISAVADGMGVSYQTANFRLVAVLNAGCAKRVTRGHYRALANEPVAAEI